MPLTQIMMTRNTPIAIFYKDIVLFSVDLCKLSIIHKKL